MKPQSWGTKLLTLHLEELCVGKCVNMTYSKPTNYTKRSFRLQYWFLDFYIFLTVYKCTFYVNIIVIFLKEARCNFSLQVIILFFSFTNKSIKFCEAEQDVGNNKLSLREIPTAGLRVEDHRREGNLLVFRLSE